MFLFEQEDFRNTTSTNMIFTFNSVALAHNIIIIIVSKLPLDKKS